MDSIIWQIPDFSTGLHFNDTTILFFIDIVILILGLFLCFEGIRAAKVVLLVCATLYFGYSGVLLSNIVTSGLLVKLIFFSSFAFIGLCAIYFIYELSLAFFKNSTSLWWGKRLSVLRKLCDFFFTFLGGFICSLTLYLRIYNNIFVTAIIFILSVSFGLFRQHTHKKNRKPFYTYDDLYRMQRRDF